MTVGVTPPPAALVPFKWQRMEEAELSMLDGEEVLSGYEADSWYYPLRQDRALFRRFASLSDKPEAYLEFAHQYGSITDDRLPVTREAGPYFGTPVAVWRAHRRLLALGIRLWDAIEGGATEDLLGGVLKVEPLPAWHREAAEEETGVKVVAVVKAPIGEERAIADGTDRELLRSVIHELETIAYLERRNLSPEAIVKTALAQYVTSRSKHLSVAMIVSSMPGAELQLTFDAKDLMGAMWLQFALAIDGHRRYRTCPICGQWWDATDARSDKLTCSDRCRKARQRQKSTTDGGE